MIYDNAIDQAKGAQQEQTAVCFRLATVTSVDANNRATIKFYGESSASSKLYPYLKGYKPTVNDDVLCVKQGSTYIIAGKIEKGANNSYYLSKSAADGYYLTQAVADTLYMPIDAPSPTPLTIENSSYYLGFTGANNGYVIGHKLNDPTKLDLGRSTDSFGAGYFETLGGTASGYAIQTLNVKDTTVYGNIVPATTNSSNIGSSSSKQFNNVYAKQFYQNGTAISTSDKRKKTGIKAITKKYISFFRNLRPALFRFKDGESGRTHCGFIAQEVEEAAHEAGIENKDLAFLCIDKEGNYGLRYEELIALQTQIIQDLLIRVEKLEEGSKK